ncbi:hypothetical protein diail_9870 [Diaporthe ilicicola]|nr:hypothetical protein diail_9870 [Diaporthe ilicicola]
MRAYPFEPMFQSMRVLNPGFRFDGVDLIINRNSLGHLLRFASGTAKCTFRLDLAMVHNTLIVTPIWERVSQKNREPNNHGRDFEDLFARRGLLDGNTHHRAVRYDLGPLSCAVLCETDAALPSPAEAMASHEQRWAFHPHPHPMPFWMKRSQFSEAWQPNTDAEKVLFSPRSQTAPKSPGPLHRPHSQVIQRGTGTLSKDTAELVSSSRSGKKMVQLWLGRVPFLVHGIHSQGSFTEVNVAYYATSFGCFENQYQGSLRRLVSLIEELRQFAVSASDQRCIAICDKTVRPLRLRIFNPDRPPALPLPVDLRRHFWTGNKTGKQPSQ